MKIVKFIVPRAFGRDRRYSYKYMAMLNALAITFNLDSRAVEVFGHHPVEITCTAEDFALFLIRRHDNNGTNEFKILQPRIVSEPRCRIQEPVYEMDFTSKCHY